MTGVTLESLCAAPTVQWRVQVYVPLLTEFASDAACEQAQSREKGRHYRLSKLVADPSAKAGHWIVTRTYRIKAIEQQSATTPCPICENAVRRGGVLVGSVAFHKKCIPGSVDPGTAEMLLMFAEELEDLRTAVLRRPPYASIG